MSVGVLLITHPGIGSAMLHTATRIIGHASLPVKCLEVPPDSSLDTVHEHARSMLKVLDRGAGVLVLTDIFGATPNNVAQTVASERAASTVLSGLNLAMLVRIFNYPDDDLDTLATKASEGGIRDITASPGSGRQ
jgi:mannose PTS system EIIA component